jgi:serine/threonine protein kinase
MMKLREQAPDWPASLWELTVDIVTTSVNALIPASLQNHPENSLVLLHRNEIKLGKQLAKGAFSEVSEIHDFLSQPKFNTSLTEHPTGQVNYVIKHLKPSLMSNPEDFQLAARDLAIEAHLMATLRHPNILKLRGLAGDGVDAYLSGRYDGFFLIFDRLEDTLDQCIDTWRNDELNGQRRDYSQPLQYASQIASAVSFLHERDIIYRDLKPKNVGIDARGNVKLFDFGFARLLPHNRNVDDTFKMTGRIGTLRYMAPEVALKEPYNLKADVYSWAVILWEILSLDQPYKTLPLEQFLKVTCQRGKRPKLDEAWPQSARDLISRSWANAIFSRPTMQEVYGDFKYMQEEMTGKKCTGVAETRKQTPSVVLKIPPVLEISTVSTVASTEDSPTRDSGIVPHQARRDPVDWLMDERGDTKPGNLAHHRPAPNAMGGRPAKASRPTRESYNRDSGIGPQQEWCHFEHFAMNEREENGSRDPTHRAASPNALGGRPAGVFSSTRHRVTRDSEIVTQEERRHRVHWSADERGGTSNSAHRTHEPNAMGGRQTGTTRNGATVSQQEMHHHKHSSTNGRRDNGSRNSSHRTPAPNTIGGRPAHTSSPNASARPSRGPSWLGRIRVGKFLRGMRRNAVENGTR